MGFYFAYKKWYIDRFIPPDLNHSSLKPEEYYQLFLPKTGYKSGNR